MATKRFTPETAGMTVLYFPIASITADTTFHVHMPFNMDIYAVNVRYEALGNADNTGNFSVEDDAVAITAVHAITDAKKAAIQDVALASADNGKKSVAAGSDIGLKVDTLAGTTKALTNVMVGIVGILKG